MTALLDNHSLQLLRRWNEDRRNDGFRIARTIVLKQLEDDLRKGRVPDPSVRAALAFLVDPPSAGRSEEPSAKRAATIRPVAACAGTETFTEQPSSPTKAEADRMGLTQLLQALGLVDFVGPAFIEVCERYSRRPGGFTKVMDLLCAVRALIRPMLDSRLLNRGLVAAAASRLVYDIAYDLYGDDPAKTDTAARAYCEILNGSPEFKAQWYCSFIRYGTPFSQDRMHLLPRSGASDRSLAAGSSGASQRVRPRSCYITKAADRSSVYVHAEVELG